MLTDAGIKALKPKDNLYKVADRDGMYVVVNPSGAVVFRYDYRLNGRRETLTLGRYGAAGLSLARAREKRRIKEAKSFGEFGERWLQEARMADAGHVSSVGTTNPTPLPLRVGAKHRTCSGPSWRR